MDIPRNHRPERRHHLLRSEEDRVPENRLTILDYLNEDCWHTVLDYLPIRDILRSELVSRQWQQVVMAYLAHVPLGVHHYNYNYGDHRNISYYSYREEPSSFRIWTKVLGNSVVSYHCKSAYALKIAGENCPNIKDMMLIQVHELLPPVPCRLNVTAAPEPSCHNFQRLQQLCFYFCKFMSDICFSQLLASKDLEVLRILVNYKLTGECLTNLRSTKLKTLVMKKCRLLEFAPLMSVVDRLSGLTKLVLKHVSDEVSSNAHLLINKMPKLEHLYVRNYCGNDGDGDLFSKAVCKLRCLKFLNASCIRKGTQIEDVVRSCGELHTLLLERSYMVRGRTLKEVQRVAGSRLAAFGARRAHHDDLVAFVGGCPNLQLLSMPRLRMTTGLAERLAAARRDLPSAPCLRVHLHNDRKDLYEMLRRQQPVEYEDVISLSSAREDDLDSDNIWEM